MIKAIIFDCFGVFIGDVTKASVLELEKTHPKRAEEFRALTHAVDKGVLSDSEGVVSQAELLGIPVEEFIALRVKGEVRNEALIEFVKTLKGKYKLAMLSNINSRQRLEARFLPGQLDELFDTVVASGDVGYIKPQPQIYQITAERLGVLPEECVLIDDIELFCEAARAVGMQAIRFMDTQQVIKDVNTLIDRGEKIY